MWKLSGEHLDSMNIVTCVLTCFLLTSWKALTSRMSLRMISQKVSGRVSLQQIVLHMLHTIQAMRLLFAEMLPIAWTLSLNSSVSYIPAFPFEYLAKDFKRHSINICWMNVTGVNNAKCFWKGNWWQMVGRESQRKFTRVRNDVYKFGTVSKERIYI